MLTLILHACILKWNTKPRKTEGEKKINITICVIIFNVKKKEKKKQCYPSCVSSLILALLAHVPRDFTSESTPTQDAGRAPTLISSLRRFDDKACNTKGNVSAPNLLMSLKISPKPLWSP